MFGLIPLHMIEETFSQNPKRGSKSISQDKAQPLGMRKGHKWGWKQYLPTHH
ncbi:hypothetical protein KSB_77670 [Ktedonobacter robiniae]|uniref:Uncharacterized protein n=1 Tax=Ktedonobacter robiniae TaxID=2778365 RepID=A0ABQ3V405_9CHLR|nr:hypothetical protein KSB_77670 [Ktedonobacter robiniae]